MAFQRDENAIVAFYIREGMNGYEEIKDREIAFVSHHSAISQYMNPVLIDPICDMINRRALGMFATEGGGIATIVTCVDGTKKILLVDNPVPVIKMDDIIVGTPVAVRLSQSTATLGILFPFYERYISLDELFVAAPGQALRVSELGEELVRTKLDILTNLVQECINIIRTISSSGTKFSRSTRAFYFVDIDTARPHVMFNSFATSVFVPDEQDNDAQNKIDDKFHLLLGESVVGHLWNMSRVISRGTDSLAYSMPERKVNSVGELMVPNITFPDQVIVRNVLLEGKTYFARLQLPMYRVNHYLPHPNLQAIDNPFEQKVDDPKDRLFYKTVEPDFNLGPLKSGRQLINFWEKYQSFYNKNIDGHVQAANVEVVEIAPYEVTPLLGSEIVMNSSGTKGVLKEKMRSGPKPIRRYGIIDVSRANQGEPGGFVDDEPPLHLDIISHQKVKVNGITFNSHDLNVFYNTPFLSYVSFISRDTDDIEVKYLTSSDTMLMKDFLNGMIMVKTFYDLLSEEGFRFLSGDRTFIQLTEILASRNALDSMFSYGVRFVDQIDKALEDDYEIGQYQYIYQEYHRFGEFVDIIRG